MFNWFGKSRDQETRVKRKESSSSVTDNNTNSSSSAGGVLVRLSANIFNTEYPKWTAEHVVDFIRHISCPEKNVDQYSPNFKSANIRGSDLQACANLEALRDLGISNAGDRIYIKSCLEELINSPTKRAVPKPKDDGSDLLNFDPNSNNPADIIKMKILQSDHLREQFEECLRENVEETRDMLGEFIAGLSDVQHCKETYFNLDWKETLEKTTRLNQLGGGDETDEMDNNNEENTSHTTSTMASTNVKQLYHQSMKFKNAVNTDNNSVDYSKEFALDEMKSTMRNPKIHIKLVLTDIGTNKTLRRFLAPIMRQTDWAQDFGMFHAALIIGPWYLEWTDSALCIPRRISSASALLSCDLMEVSIDSTHIDDIAHKLAETAVVWNLTKKYKNFSKDVEKATFGNCQDFVLDVMQRLGIKLEFSGEMAKFIQKMRDKGRCELEFEPSKQFLEAFPFLKDQKSTGKNVIFRFDTHQQLDRFVQRLLEFGGPRLQLDFRGEWAILKSFDRAFWLKHIKHREKAKTTNAQVANPELMVPEFSPEFSPLWKNEVSKTHNCPFDDPENTRSFMRLY